MVFVLVSWVLCLFTVFFLALWLVIVKILRINELADC